MKKLVTIRKKHGFTQRELARRMGVTQSSLAQYETGARKPNIVMLKKLAAILDCTTDQLLEDIEIKEENT